MVQTAIYSDRQLPKELHAQIISFLRIQWPDGFMGENRLRDWISRKEFHPVHLVLVEDKDIVVGYLAVVWKQLKHAGKIYKTYGLSGVFIYPSFRKQAYGLRMVQEAKRYIQKQDGDVILFTSKLTGFYEQAGFLRLKGATFFKGSVQNPEQIQENVYIAVLSEKGKKGEKDFVTKPIYFGQETW